MHVAADFINGLAKRRDFRASELAEEDELKLLEEAEQYMGTMLNATVTIEKEEESKSQRAAKASPEKPSIDVA